MTGNVVGRQRTFKIVSPDTLNMYIFAYELLGCETNKSNFEFIFFGTKLQSSGDIFV